MKYAGCKKEIEIDILQFMKIIMECMLLYL